MSPDFAEADDDVAAAYATLAGFHARRGEFEQEESLAMAASALGDSTGLITFGWELLQRGDRANAERLALCAVNMVETRRWVSPDQEPRRTLVEARGDATLLTWGLEADPSLQHGQTLVGRLPQDHSARPRAQTDELAVDQAITP